MVVRQHLGAGLVTRGVRRRKDGGSRRARATPQLERWRYTRSDGLKRFNRDSSARTGPGLWLAVCRDFRVVRPAIQTQGRASTKARPICLAATSTRAYASSLPACTSGDIILNDMIVPENKVTFQPTTKFAQFSSTSVLPRKKVSYLDFELRVPPVQT